MYSMPFEASVRLRYPAFLLLIPLLLSPAQAFDWPVGPETNPVDTAAYATVIHVCATHGDDRRGTGSPESPLASIPSALTRAISAPAPQAILVAAGAYGGATLQLKENVHLYGGFASGDWKRDILRHRTVLDGEQERRVVVAAEGALLDGFHIKNGRVAGYGAGILCDGVTATLTNNVFAGNRVLAPEGWDPEFRHELAWDGGGLACINGSHSIVRHNRFVANDTVIGRGAGLVVHLYSHPQITRNVFMDNVAGLEDSMRSSDGAAISVYGYCDPLIENNLIAMNRALTNNDAGGIFVALWANPVIRRNWLLGNYSDDDGGALFIGGQEHRYDRPFDPVPPAERFDIRVEENILMGNRNPSGNSGAMRITMETRGRLINNVIARNYGGVYLQRSEMKVYHNTIDDDLLLIETREWLQPYDVRNNVILGFTEILAPTLFTHNATRNFTYGEGNTVVHDREGLFVDDHLTAPVHTMRHRPDAYLTQFDLYLEGRELPDMTARPIRFGEFWSAVHSHRGDRIQVWGLLPEVEPGGPLPFIEFLPTFQLEVGSPFAARGVPIPEVTEDLNRTTRPDPPALGAFEPVP